MTTHMPPKAIFSRKFHRSFSRRYYVMPSSPDFHHASAVRSLVMAKRREHKPTVQRRKDAHRALAEEKPPHFYSTSSEIKGHLLTGLGILFLCGLIVYIYAFQTKQCHEIYPYWYWDCPAPVQNALDSYYRCFLVLYLFATDG